MAKCAIHARTDKQDHRGRVPLRLCISHKGIRRYLSLEYTVPLRDWNAKNQRVRKSNRHHHKINAYLARVLNECEDVLLDMKMDKALITASMLRDRIRKRILGLSESDQAIEYFRVLTERYRGRNQIAVYKKTKSVVRKFNAFLSDLGLDGLPLSEISLELLEQFRTHLIKAYGNSINTTSRNLRVLGTLLNTAVREGKLEYSPFSNMKLRYEKTEKVYLTRSELERFKNLPLAPGSTAHHVQQLFIFQVYTQGMRFSDAITFSFDSLDGEYIKYRMRKNGKYKSMLITQEAGRIIDLYFHRRAESNYLFPFLDKYQWSGLEQELQVISGRNESINKILRKLIEQCGLDKRVRTHSARHTFANLAMEDGWPLEKISQALEHADFKTTKIYLRELTCHDLDEEMKRFM